MGLSLFCLPSQLVLGWGPSGEDSDHRQGLGGLHARRHWQPLLACLHHWALLSLSHLASPGKGRVFTTPVLSLPVLATSGVSREGYLDRGPGAILPVFAICPGGSPSGEDNGGRQG